MTEAKEVTGTNTSPNWTQAFGYDIYGNRTSFAQVIGGIQTNGTPLVNPNTNRFTSASFTYDKNGNITRDTDSVTNQTRQFVFNGDNKQTEVKDANGTPIGKYYYDGEGKRVKKVTATETTIFVYSGGNLVAEYSTQISQNPSISYTTTDHLGSPRVITDKTGNVKSRRDFMPFGEDIFVGVGGRTGDTGQRYSSSADDIRQKFTGYQKDGETNLDFAEARMYENRYGRFTAVDPLLASGKSANPQTFNRYTYTSNNPIGRVDRNGLDWYEFTETKVRRNGTSVSVQSIYWNGTDPNNLAGRSRYTGPGVYQEGYGKNKGRWTAIDPYEGRMSFFKTRAGAVAQYQLYLQERNINATRGFADALSNMIGDPVMQILYGLGADAIIGRPDPNSNVYTITNRTSNAIIMVALTSTGFVEIPMPKASVDVGAPAEVVTTAETKIVSTLEPGPFATRSIPARGPGPLNAAEQAEVNAIGQSSGCHTCGATNPGTRNGNFIGDHQPPSKLAEPFQLYPHCFRCSTSQGGVVSTVQRGFFTNPYLSQ